LKKKGERETKIYALALKLVLSLEKKNKSTKKQTRKMKPKKKKKHYKNNQPAIPIMCTYRPGFCYCQTKEKHETILSLEDLQKKKKTKS
jgi:hypothetical protein